MRTFIIFWLVCSTLQAQGWEVVKAVPPGTLLRVNSSVTGRVDSVDDTQITLNGRRLRQDVIRRVERVESRRKRNAGLALLGGFCIWWVLRVGSGYRESPCARSEPIDWRQRWECLAAIDQRHTADCRGDARL